MTQLKPIKGKFVVLVPHDGYEWAVAGAAVHSDDPCGIISEWSLAEGMDSADYDVHILEIEVPVVQSPRFGIPKCRAEKKS